MNLWASLSQQYPEYIGIIWADLGIVLQNLLYFIVTEDMMRSDLLDVYQLGL